jgi:hypothetical protein
MILATMKKNVDSVLNLFLHVIPEINEYDDVCTD